MKDGYHMMGELLVGLNQTPQFVLEVVCHRKDEILCEQEVYCRKWAYMSLFL
jgi:hypothetical protein